MVSWCDTKPFEADITSEACVHKLTYLPNHLSNHCLICEYPVPDRLGQVLRSFMTKIHTNHHTYPNQTNHVFRV